MTDEREQMLKIAHEREFMDTVANIGWDTAEVIRYAKICGKVFTPMQASAFLNKHRVELEAAMIEAGLDVIERALKSAA